jgi:hypothetical protein
MNSFYIYKRKNKFKNKVSLNNSMDTQKLNNEFTLWYHNPNDTSWTQDSYHQILSFTNFEEFWTLDYFIGKEMIEEGMFFVMKDDVLPIWEDDLNKDGGYISWKVDKRISYTYWTDLIGYLITNNLMKDEVINGISISPKKNFNIIKLWFKEPIVLAEYVLPDGFKLNNNEKVFKLHQTYLSREKDKDKK